MFDMFKKKPQQTIVQEKASYDTQVNRNLQGIDLEKTDLDKAITLYEQNIAEGFEGNHPYDRLAIIYHKQKRYEDEKRVLRRGIEVFSQLDRQDVPAKLQKFKDRLSKLEES